MKTILILDDEPAVRQSIADFFEDCLWWPIQAGSAEEALQLLATEVPAAAVVDVRLPGMDGNTFIREVWQRGIKMAFVICTGSPEYDMPEDLLALPFVSDQLYKKPVTNMADMEREILHLIELVEQME